MVNYRFATSFCNAVNDAHKEDYVKVVATASD